MSENNVNVVSPLSTLQDSLAAIEQYTDSTPLGSGESLNPALANYVASGSLTAAEQAPAPSIENPLEAGTSAAANIATGGVYGAVKSIFSLSVGNTVAIVLGLILIAGGLFFFKPVQQAATTAARAAAA